AGPFGQADNDPAAPWHDLRTVATDLHADRVAGVSSGGDALWIAPVKDTGEAPRGLLSEGEDLLNPAWDFRGRLWEVDRRSTGAVVYYLRKNQMVPLAVPGLIG